MDHDQGAADPRVGDAQRIGPIDHRAGLAGAQSHPLGAASDGRRARRRGRSFGAAEGGQSDNENGETS